MRYTILVLALLVIISGILANKSFLGKIAFNPSGNAMPPKLMSDNDDGSRTPKVVNNKNTPDWERVNYGKLDNLKSVTSDANGSKAISYGDGVPPIVDMRENAEVESKVTSVPSGTEVTKLPGYQPDGTIQNALVLSLEFGKYLLAPRSYYTYERSFEIDDNHQLSKQLSYEYSESLKSLNLTVFQVPYGDEFLVSDSTGTSETVTQARKLAVELNDFLTKLSYAANNNASISEVRSLLFSPNGDYSTDMENLNNLINTGRYAEAYKRGLTLALGNLEQTTDAFYPRSEILITGSNNTIYSQFDLIYDSLASGKALGLYPAELVNWASLNVDSIVQVLMVNYMLQSQFSDTNAQIEVPILRNIWGEKSLPFYKDLVAKGLQTKEPLFLYCILNAAEMNKVYSDSTTPKIDPVFVVPDLAYIFEIYTAIMAQVWSGADTSDSWYTAWDTGYRMDLWESVISKMNKTIKSSAVVGSAPKDSNKINNDYSTAGRLSLASGLSNTSYGKKNTAAVYGSSKNVVAALRILLSKGERGAPLGKFRLGGDDFPITDIGENKYSLASLKNESFMYEVFFRTSGKTYDKYAAMLRESSSIPEAPATFTSSWGTSEKYIMMPAMLGGTKFPIAVKNMLVGLAQLPDSNQTLDQMSYANRFIVAMNFEVDQTSSTRNTTGLKQVFANSRMGSSRDAKKPIIFSGYLGGESFNLADFIRSLESVSRGDIVSGVLVKDKTGTYKYTGQLNLLQNFFSVNSLSGFSGGQGNGTVAINDELKIGYISLYNTNSASPIVKAISPDFSKFFD